MWKRSEYFFLPSTQKSDAKINFHREDTHKEPFLSISGLFRKKFAI